MANQNNLFLFLRWNILPVIFIFLMWSLFLFPGQINHLPSLWTTSKSIAKVAILEKVIPTDTKQAFQLGTLFSQYTYITANTSYKSKTKDEILTEATKVLNLNRLQTDTEFTQMLGEIQKVENHRSAIQKFRGLFSFVGLIWAISIIGMMCTVCCCLAACGSIIKDACLPFCRLISGFLTFLANLIEIFWNYFKIIWKFGLESGISEVIGYALVYLSIVQGFREKDQNFGVFTALAGSLAIFPLSCVSARVWEGNEGSILLFLSIIFLQMGLVSFPQAMQFTSSMIAWTTSIFMFTSLVSWTLLAITFNYFRWFGNYDTNYFTENTLCKVYAATGLLMSFVGIFITLAFEENGKKSVMSVFASPLIIIGSTVFYGLMIILSSDYSKDLKRYYMLNLFYVFSQLMGQFIGRILNVEWLNTVSVVFIVLFFWLRVRQWLKWCNEKYSWVAQFLLSLCMWNASHYVHKNPDIVKRIFMIKG